MQKNIGVALVHFVQPRQMRARPAPIGALFGKQSDGHQMHHHGQVRMRGGGFDLGGEIGRQRRQRALAQAAHHRPQRLRGAHIFHFGIGHLAL